MDLSTTHPRPSGHAAPTFASFSTIRRPSSEGPKHDDKHKLPPQISNSHTHVSHVSKSHTLPFHAAHPAQGRTSSNPGHETSSAGAAMPSTQAHQNHVPISGLISHTSSISHRAGTGSGHSVHMQRIENVKSTSTTSQSSSHAGPGIARPISTSAVAGSAGVRM